MRTVRGRLRSVSPSDGWHANHEEEAVYIGLGTLLLIIILIILFA